MRIRLFSPHKGKGSMTFVNNTTTNKQGSKLYLHGMAYIEI